MENKVQAVKDGQELELCNKATESIPSKANETDLDKKPTPIKDVPGLEESKLNNSNGTDASAENVGPITSPLGNPDVLNNGFLAAKSPCNIGNIEAVNGTSTSIGNEDASSMHVGKNNLLAADARQPESAAKESVDKSRDPLDTGNDKPVCGSAKQGNTIIIKSSEDVAVIKSSEYDEQTMTALLEEAVQDEIVISGDSGTSDQESAHNTGELPESTESSKTQLFKAAIEEFSRGGVIPASLPDSQSDETAMSKSMLKGEAFQKLLQTFEDQLQKAFGEENGTSQKQSGEASTKAEKENSNGNENLIPAELGSGLPDKNNLPSEC